MLFQKLKRFNYIDYRITPTSYDIEFPTLADANEGHAWFIKPNPSLRLSILCPRAIRWFDSVSIVVWGWGSDVWKMHAVLSDESYVCISKTSGVEFGKAEWNPRRSSWRIKNRWRVDCIHDDMQIWITVLAGLGPKLRGIPAGCIECFFGLIKVTMRSLAIRMTYNKSFGNKISAMNERMNEMLTFILELGISDSAILFRRWGSSLRQLRADMVMLRSNSNLNIIDVMKDSAPRWQYSDAPVFYSIKTYRVTNVWGQS